MRVLTILLSIQSYMASIKAKKKRKAGPKAARKRAPTSTTSLEPAPTKISKNIQQDLPESSQIGELQAVDEKIKVARIKEMV